MEETGGKTDGGDGREDRWRRREGRQMEEMGGKTDGGDGWRQMGRQMNETDGVEEETCRWRVELPIRLNYIGRTVPHALAATLGEATHSYTSCHSR